MKKLLTITTTITLVLISAALAQAKVSPEAVERQTASAERKAVKIPLYLNTRVKTMCQEWPGCEKWGRARYNKNNSFRIRDAEVEYYVVDSLNNCWNYNLYVEVLEDKQIQTYKFSAKLQTIYAIRTKKKQEFQPTPVKLNKKFPGHPFIDMPSQHAKYVKGEIRKKWPSAIGPFWEHIENASEQQRVIWDQVTGKPLWERRLEFYLQGSVDDGERVGSLIAHQQKSGGPFQYVDAKKTSSILKRHSAWDIPNFYL